MERMTIPDVMIDEKTTRRTIVDASEVRKHAMEFYWRLKSIEDILGDDYDLDRLRELVQADRDRRVNILPECVGKNCGTCANFNRVSGSRHGTCKVRKHPVDRYGQENKEIEFQPVQSRIACKKYISEKAELKGEQDG